jgi:hypothetical protein
MNRNPITKKKRGLYQLLMLSFGAVLPRAETFKQLFCARLCSLMTGVLGPEHVRAGVL